MRKRIKRYVATVCVVASIIGGVTLSGEMPAQAVNSCSAYAAGPISNGTTMVGTGTFSCEAQAATISIAVYIDGAMDGYGAAANSSYIHASAVAPCDEVVHIIDADGYASPSSFGAGSDGGSVTCPHVGFGPVQIGY